MVRKEPPEFLWGLIPTKRPKVESTRGGTSFWVHAGRDGIKSDVLTVPVTFPPEEIEHGRCSPACRLPDIRGTLGTYYYWATDFSRYEEGNTEFGGIVKRLVFDGDTPRRNWSARRIRCPPDAARGAIEGVRPTDADRRRSPSSRRARTSGCR